MATFIDRVRCGACDAWLTLEAATVVVQRYRRRAWLQHFWVYCECCRAHKLYWPTARQLRLADGLGCRTRLDEAPTSDVVASYARNQGLPGADRHRAVDLARQDLAYLLTMLAATCQQGMATSSEPTASYLPAHWAN